MEDVMSKIKKLDSKKMTLGSFSMLSLIAVIIGGSIIPLTFDFDNLFTTSWWVNEIFVIVVAIWSVVCMNYMGQAYNAGDERSNIAKARKKFRLYNDQVIVETFIQWVEQVLEVRDQMYKNKRILREVGYKQPEVVNLKRADLKSLLEGPQRIDGHWFEEITEEQYDVALELKSGKYNIQFVNPRYYLTEYGYDTDLTVSERALREEKIKKKILISNLIIKIFMVVLIGVIFSSFARDMLTEVDKQMVVLRLVSRIFTAISGSYVGYMSGTGINDVTASYLDLKAEIMREQLADKNFKPKSVEEQAKEHFIEKNFKTKEEEIQKLENNKEIILGGS